MGDYNDGFGMKFPKLTAERYHSWKFNMMMYLKGTDLWDIVDGVEIVREGMTAADKIKWRKREQRALSHICLAVEDSLQIYVRNTKTSTEAWQSLANHFEEKTLSRKIKYLRQLYDARPERGAGMLAHVNNLKTISEHLEALDHAIAERDLVMTLISSLPPSYNNLVTALETLREDNLTWNYVRDRVISEYERRKGDAPSKKDSEALVVEGGRKQGGGAGGGKFGNRNKPQNKQNNGQQQQNNNNKKTFGGTCHFCHEKGHMQRDCEKKAEAARKKLNEANLVNQAPVAAPNEDADVLLPAFALHVSCASPSDEYPPSNETSSVSSVAVGETDQSDDVVLLPVDDIPQPCVVLSEVSESEFVSFLSSDVEEFSQSDEVVYLLPDVEEFSLCDDVVEESQSDAVVSSSSDVVEESQSDAVVSLLSDVVEESQESQSDAVVSLLSDVVEESQESQSDAVVSSLSDVVEDFSQSNASVCPMDDDDVKEAPQVSVVDPTVNSLKPEVSACEVLEIGPPVLQFSGTARCSLTPEMALQVGDSPEGNSDWWLDSGATQHMTGVMEDFVRYEAVKNHGGVTLADKSLIPVHGIGEVMIVIHEDDNQTAVLFKEVLYVPGLKKRLLSVSCITESGGEVRFKGKECTLIMNDRTYSFGHKFGKLWRLNNTASCFFGCANSDNVNSLASWHVRFGHLNTNDIKKLHDENLVDGMTLSTKDVTNLCEGCALGKHSRDPFPKKSKSKSTELLELIHTDVCGPLNVASLGGSIYYVTFIDDFSSYVTIYMMKQKSEVFEKWVEFVAMAENHCGKRVKNVRADNGGEYIGESFVNFCKERGIQRQPTIPYTPQQNGKSERMNRTIMDNVRATLYHANLPLYLWAEAAANVVYLRNRSPTSSLKGATPYEVWHGVKPNVGNLRAFGCDVYVHVPDEKRKKLDAKSMKGMFVGYPDGSKGYKVFVPESQQKFFRSRDVKFMEASFVNSSARKDTDGEELHEILTQQRDIDASVPSSSKSVYFGDFEEIQSDVSENDGTDDAVEVDAADEAVEETQTSTRPIRNRVNPSRYGDWAMIADAVNTGEWAAVADAVASEPKTYKQALRDRNAAEWIEAMDKEYSSLMNHSTWDLVDLPHGRKAVGCKWVYKAKRNANGDINRYKARLVAQGFSQEAGIDYHEVFAPVARYKSIRSVLAIANQFNLEVHQMDVVSAFLNGELEDEIFMRQPEGFVDPNNSTKVCKLNRSLYGLKQSARCWNLMMDDYLKSSGYTQSAADPCVYYRTEVKNGKNIIMIFAVYVDDTIICSNDTSTLCAEKQRLREAFEMDDRGEIHHILGMEVIRDRKNRVLTIDQKTYLKDVLKRFGMEECRPVATPIEPGKNFTKRRDDEEPADETMFQAAIGSINYAAIATRPDLSTAVGKLSQFMKNPSAEHWVAVKRVLRYIKGTLNLGLKYTYSDKFELHGYSDSDWAGCVDSRKSTTGNVHLLGNCAISWSSKKQSIVALSSTEAEYVALCSAAQETVWLRNLLSDIGCTQNTATLIREDNQGAICLAKNPKDHPRTKHIDVRYHYVRETVERKVMRIEYIPTGDMTADALTKGLPKPSFEKHRLGMGVEPRLGI